ncbi:MAG: histidine triad nucleotide-binding protein [Anaerolineae bacterium]|jgi:histidine triad (HIT) family protein|nr:histidine triad nucleotide-binding protein [Anaerolineae bacterium]MBT3713200.1 histidine triad nucleotide-binding protein [Anaerolineae bacterium]MBT4311880.1 histidine triad nucleotide-binding protein [Anaerolineae bacterium]MBT4458354.1 histidine triad nucleotide-binding protein [Anaerolineae bacterium]MBT6059897.1 histidine triad nucleotide-binding protein [Anaerolineae bacterium]
MTENCIFCKIIAKEAPAEILYSDEFVTAFRDIQPAAPIHILIVPNKHIPSLNEVTPEDEILIGHLHTVAQKLAKEEGIAERGYRVVINTGKEGGQMVYHLHLHLMGGKKLSVPKHL